MSATVRSLRTGMAITYNSATQQRIREGGIELLNDRGFLVATVPAGADMVVEWARPCSINNGSVTLEDALKLLVENGAVCELRGWQAMRRLADLKRILQDFNARSECWKSQR